MREKKLFKDSTRKNILAIYFIYLIILASYMLDNLFWNFFTRAWVDSLLLVFINPVDNFVAFFVAILIRAVFGQIEEI